VDGDRELRTLPKYVTDGVSGNTKARAGARASEREQGKLASHERL